MNKTKKIIAMILAMSMCVGGCGTAKNEQPKKEDLGAYYSKHEQNIKDGIVAWKNYDIVLKNGNKDLIVKTYDKNAEFVLNTDGKEEYGIHMVGDDLYIIGDGKIQHAKNDHSNDTNITDSSSEIFDNIRKSSFKYKESKDVDGKKYDILTYNVSGAASGSAVAASGSSVDSSNYYDFYVYVDHQTRKPEFITCTTEQDGVKINTTLKENKEQITYNLGSSKATECEASQLAMAMLGIMMNFVQK